VGILALSGCGISTRSTSSATTVPRVSTTAGPTTSPTPPGPTTTINPAIAAPVSGVEFYSPSHNLNCEIDYGAPATNQTAFCFSGDPPASATLSTSGTYQTCSGTQCLANPGQGAVELPYGQTVTLGPFACTSSTSGMTCTADGKGFQISRSGVAAAPPS